MLPLNSEIWGGLQHAYGAASDLPRLLQEAEFDSRPGHHTDSAWFRLWSALCHQGDVYSASYAAVPHLIAMAPAKLAQRMYDPLLLVAMIELARLEGRGPAVSESLDTDYVRAISEATTLVAQAVPGAWDRDARIAFEGGLAALRGDIAAARAILDVDDGDTGD